MHSLGQGWRRQSGRDHGQSRTHPSSHAGDPGPSPPPQGPAGVAMWHRQLWERAGAYSTPFMNSRNSVERKIGLGQRRGLGRVWATGMPSYTPSPS